MFEELHAPPTRPLPLASFRMLGRAILPVFAIGAALIVLATATQGYFLLQYREARALAGRGARVEGTLVDKISGRYFLRLTVVYRSGDRRVHSVRQWIRAGPGTRWVLLGDRVGVFYDPAEPERACVEPLALPRGSPAGSLPVALGTGLATLAGVCFLSAATRFLRKARRLLREGTLVPARILEPARWKNAWLARFEISHAEKVHRRRGFVPPGWRSAVAPTALVFPGRKPVALLLIEPSPEEW